MMGLSITSRSRGSRPVPGQMGKGISRLRQSGGIPGGAGTGRASGKAPGFPSHSRSRGYTTFFYNIKLEIIYLLRRRKLIVCSMCSF